MMNGTKSVLNLLTKPTTHDSTFCNRRSSYGIDTFRKGIGRMLTISLRVAHTYNHFVASKKRPRPASFPRLKDWSQKRLSEANHWISSLSRYVSPDKQNLAMFPPLHDEREQCRSTNKLSLPTILDGVFVSEESRTFGVPKGC
jgi:hypothetical protein